MMTKCYLDSNVLVYFKDNTSDKHKKSILLLKKLLAKGVTFCVSTLVLDEFIHSTIRSLRIAGQKDILLKAKAMFDEILGLPRFLIISPPLEIEKQRQIFELMDKYNLKPRDGYHVLTAISNGVDYFATFDQDFRLVFRAKVLKKAS